MITFIFGDSITEGLWDSEGGWADRLKAYVQAEEVKSGIKNYHEVYNLGIDGNTTKQVIERFEPEVRVRLWPEEEYVFIFAIGANDTLQRKNSDFESTPEQYKTELNQLLEVAKKYSSRIIFVDLLPVDENLTNPLKSSSSGKSYTNNRVNLFNQVLHTFCDSNSLPYIKVSEAYLSQDYKSLLVDGIHPDSKGHKLIAELIRPKLEEFLDA